MEHQGFWGGFVKLLEDETIRGVVSAGLMMVLSVPMAAVGQALKAIPDLVLPPERIPPILAMAGLIAGFALGFYTPLPTDLSIAVGMGAGLGSQVAHDQHRAWKKPNNGGA